MRIAGDEQLPAIAVMQVAVAALEQPGAADLQLRPSGLQRAMRELLAHALGIRVPVQPMPAHRAQRVIALRVQQQRMHAGREQDQAQPGGDGSCRGAHPADAAAAPRQFHPAVRGDRQRRHQQQRQRFGQRRLQAHGPAEQHEDRPMPQVQRIRDAANRHRRALRQRPLDPAGRRTVQQRQQAQRAEHRPQAVGPRRVPGARAPQPEADQAQRQRQQRRTPVPGRPRRWRSAAIETPAQRQRLIQQHAAAQLPEARGGQIERIAGLAAAAAAQQRIRQRAGRDQRHQQQRPHAAAAAAVPGQQQQREQQVELLFHAQRPGMRIRIELGLRRKIIAAGSGQHPVAEADEGHPPGLGAGLAQPGVGDEQAAGQRGDQQAGQQRRRDAAHAPRVELREHAAAAGRRQALQRGADHETGNHEEHIDAGEPARQPGRIQVVGDDRQHCERTQSVDIRQIAAHRVHGRWRVQALGACAPHPWERHAYQTRSSGIWYFGSA